jgi:hypothetical protein
MSETYKHKEAFMLMQYACDTCKRHEVIWNSRDGVTPFTTSCIDPACNGVSSHVNWDADSLAPTFKPAAGSRYFADCSEAYALEIAKKRLDFAKGTNAELGEGSDAYNHVLKELVNDITGSPVVLHRPTLGGWNDSPECPHCQYEDECWWDGLGIDVNDGSEWKADCPGCGKEYHVTTCVETTFTTRDTDQFDKDEDDECMGCHRALAGFVERNRGLCDKCESDL